jgi:hypothetical protein
VNVLAATFDRIAQLEVCARQYALNRLAITWTAGIEGDAARAVRTSWSHIPQLPSADGGAFAAGLFAGRGLTRNPAIVARASRLVIVECDTPQGLAEVEALELPWTWTVRSSAPHRRHWYFRWPHDVDPEFVSFRFESDRITADRDHYYLAPPALHRSGSIYAFLPGRRPDDLPIAELPEDAYWILVRLAGRDREASQATAASPMLGVAPSAPLDRDELARQRLQRILDANTIEDAERLAATRPTSPFAYGQRVLETACARIAAAERGSRHTTINKSAFVVGGFVAATGLDRSAVIGVLTAAAEKLVADDATFGSAANRAQTARSIMRGLAAGEDRPRSIPEANGGG